LTNFQPESSYTSSDAVLWRPVQVPGRRATTSFWHEFYAYMLLPGFSFGFHAATLGRSRTSIATYRNQAEQAAGDGPEVGVMVLRLLGAMSAEDGLEMARHRGGSQLPHWSRLAIREFKSRGLDRQELSEAFCCSPGTIANVLSGKGMGYRPMSGERILTAAQRSPPARRSRAKV
jgi:hypothetical protein